MNNLVEELSQQCESFDKKCVIKKLNDCYERDKAFHLRAPKQIKYVARKHSLANDKCLRIYQDLMKENIDNSTKLLLAQAIKYSIAKKDADIKFEKLVEILQKNNNVDIQSEILWILGYQTRNSVEQISTNLVDQIRSFLEEAESQLNVDSVNFLNQQIQYQSFVSCRNHRSDLSTKLRISIDYLRKLTKTIVTKTQQTVKIKHKNNESAELKHQLNLAKFFMNSQKKIEMKSNRERLPTVPDENGSDTSMWKDAYTNVESLYNRVVTGQVVRKVDKDNFLPSNVLSFTYQGLLSVHDSIHNLFINRMIAAIFLEVSKKQMLHDKAIKSLMQYIDNLESLEKQIFTHHRKITTANRIAKANITGVVTLNGPIYSRRYKNGPMLIADIANKIFDANNSDAEEISKTLTSEVNNIRIAAISAFHNCALRDNRILTEERLEKIERLSQEDNDNDFKNHLIHLLKDLADSRDIDHLSLFETCLSLLETANKDNNSVDYIYQQSIHETRSQLLFNQVSISRIIRLLRRCILTEKTKRTICLIIENYLERSYSQPLNEDNLQILSSLISSSEYSEDLKIEVLKSILFTVEKNQLLPKFLLENLMKNLHKGNENFDNILILVLEFISERQAIPHIDELARKLLDNSVVVREGTDISFERTAKYTNDDQTVSSIVAHILSNSLKMNVTISHRSLKYLVEALNSHDQQTCILAAKSLHIAAETHEIDYDILVELKEHINSRIHDVSVYLTVAFSRSLAKFASADKQIFPSHFEILPKIFVFDDLKIDDKSFAEIVNKNILIVLIKEAKHRKFDEEFFQIFDHLLSFENEYAKQTVEILQTYIKNKYLIPKKTICVLENCIDIPELSKEIFANIIFNEQIVSEKILNLFCDNLYLSDDKSVRDQSFKVLIQADHNQDISDRLFDVLELEKASLSISTCSHDVHHAMAYLYKKTEENLKLTINCFRTLTDAFDTSFALDEILKILLNTSTNGQIIPNELVDKIVNSYNPDREQNYFIEIFENVVRNNQEISEGFLLKLEQTLENTQYVDRILLIFIFLGQKSEKISRKNLLKIVEHFSTINDPLVIQQYLSFICSVVEKQDYLEDFDVIFQLQKAFVHSIKTNHIEIIRKAVQAFQRLVFIYKIKLDQKDVDVLLNLLENDICDANIQHQIRMILDTTQLDDNQLLIVQFSSLNGLSNEEFIRQLIEFDQTKLLENNFRRINAIIDYCPNLILKALKVLCKCSNKQDISETLFNSMMVLLSSTNLQEIRVLCCEILVQTRQFNDEILSTIIDQIDRDGSIIKSILENRSIPQEFRDRIDLYLKDFYSTINHFINKTQEKLTKGIQLSTQCIEKLFSLEIHPRIEQQLIDIYALILIQQPDYSTHDKIVESIEKSILSQKMTLNVLNAYKEIIKRTTCQSKISENVIQFFINNLNKSNEFNLDIFICISLASETGNISNFKPFETNLFHQNEIVRYWSFRGLRAVHERDRKSIEFEQWCENMMKNLEEKLQVQVKFDLDLFETITTLKYIDYEQIRTKSQDQWIRELVIFDLIERLQITTGERLQFYQMWLEIEEEKVFLKDQSDILLKLIHHSYIHNQISNSCCLKIIQILKNIDFENASNILFSRKNPLRDFHKLYLTNMIQKRLRNPTEINTTYVESLISEKFQFDISVKLLNALANLDNLAEFQNILTFAEENQIQISDIYIKDQTIAILKRSLEIKFLGNQIKETNRLLLGTCIDSLLDNHWTFQQLKEILSTCRLSQNRKNERYAIEILAMLSDYKLSPTEENRNSILLILRQPNENWIQEINRIIVECTFTRIGQVKNTVELIEEFETNNAHVIQLADGNLSSWIERIKSSTLTSHLLKENIPIGRWGVDRIQRWAKNVKRKVKTNGSNWTHSEDFIVEACAVTKRANYLATGFHLTDAQILSCLVALHTNSDQGRLLQVATGEGKSIIISILAVIHALRGNNVDIITSSPVLAKRDSIKQKKFYHMFELECSHNNDTSIYLTGPKPCYQKQIVYGEAAQFQFDTLRTEYAQLNTLGDRKYNVAIVDEVDNMLIDDSSKIARLATAIPGMDQLQVIYHFLWYQLITLQNKIIYIDNSIYLFYGTVGFEEDIMFLEYADEEGTIFKISDLKCYLSSTRDISHIGKSVSGEDQIVPFLKEQLDAYIKKLITENIIKISKHFQTFVDRKIPKWIDNAITAFYLKENVHYIIHDGLIKPVDYDSTGLVQSSSNWSNGLHQFLQIKHNLKMTSETCTTNFLSNKGYFTRYGSNLFGLTGTLGSQKAKEVLARVYKVDLVLIPNLRQKQYRSLSDIVTNNQTDWLKEICRSAIRESNKGRGTLIICETIEYSQIIVEKLRRESRAPTIKLYAMNDMNQEKNVEIIHSKEIIVATNLAGRGTDIKTDEIEAYGGLHVIITFMPPNKRVEEQAFGRTARQGKRGTGQRILNTVDSIHYENCGAQEISELRDKMESDMLDKFLEKDLELISLKDELFSKFCSLLSQIRKDIHERNGFITQTTNQIRNIFKFSMRSAFESNLLMSIEEQWAMLLEEIDDITFPIDRNEIYQKFETFRRNILEDYKNDCVIKSPYYHINIGNDLIINDSSLNSTYDRAMKHFNRAIELDPDHSAAAFVGQGWLQLKGKKRFFRSDQHKSSYKQEAIELFHRALQILDEEMSQIISIQILLQNRSANINTALSKQLIQKANILGSYCKNIETMITIIRKSQRLIQITEHIDNRGESKQIILYDEIDKEQARPCDIRLMARDHLTNHENAIKNIEEIGIVKNDETQFLIVFMPKTRNQLAKIIVDDQKLKGYLVHLSYDETILSRDTYSVIYMLIYKKVKSSQGFIEGNISKFIEKFQSDREYQITFNDLTVRKDVSTIDQALDAIDNVIPEIERETYENICVSINQINGKIFKDFINPNIEIEEVTKEEALAQLTDKSSFFHRHFSSEWLSSDSCLIDFEIIYNNKSSERRIDFQAKEVIDFIKNQTEHTSHYNLTFKSANQTSKILTEKVLSESNISVEFLRLNAENIQKKLEKIQSRSINLELTDTKEKLLQVIVSYKIPLVEIDLEKNKGQTYNKKIVDYSTAVKLIKDMTATSLSVKLLDLNNDRVKSITDTCPNATYNISFISVVFPSLLGGLEDECISIHFDELKKDVAKTLIEQIRIAKFDFSLTLKNLTNQQLSNIIDLASVEQENIEINKTKTLGDLFMNELAPYLELGEFSARGIEYLLEINEKKFVPWMSIGCIVAIASVQMTVGTVFVATGFGATVGLGLITEGGADLFIGFRAYNRREFSWTDYGKQKAVSLIISVVSMGVSSVKDAGKGVRNLLTAVADETLEQAGTMVITNGKSLGQVVAQSGETLSNLCRKQVCVTIGQNALRESLNKVADISSNLILEQFKPQISASIQSKVSAKFSERNLLRIVRKMYTIDSFNKNQQWKQKIDTMIVEIVNPENSFFRKQWNSIGEPLCKGILSNGDRINSAASLGIRILGSLNGMYQITSIIDTVHEQLVKKLSQIDQEILSMENLLCKYCQIDKENIEEIFHIFRQQNIMDLNEELNHPDFATKIAHVDFHGFQQYKNKVTQFLTSLHTSMSNIEFNDPSEPMKLISDMITEQIFRIVESELISPWSTYGMGSITKFISEAVQHHFIVDPKQNSDSQNREIQQQGNIRYNTIEQQIKYHARDYAIAYSQCEIIHYSQQRNSTDSKKKMDQHTEDYVNNIRKGQPSSMLEVISLGSDHKLGLKIVDDPNYQRTEEDKEKGTNIVLYTKEGDNSAERFHLISNDGTVVNMPGESSDSGYAIIQKLLKDRNPDISIESLRNQMAQIVENNPQQFSYALRAQRWIESRYPQEANTLLMKCSNTNAARSKLLLVDNICTPIATSGNSFRTMITNSILDYVFSTTEAGEWSYMFVIVFIFALILLEYFWYQFCFYSYDTEIKKL